MFTGTHTHLRSLTATGVIYDPVAIQNDPEWRDRVSRLPPGWILDSDHVKYMSHKLAGTPVLMEHVDSSPVGYVTHSWIDERGRWCVRLRLVDTGNALSVAGIQGLKYGAFLGLSLQHAQNQLSTVEVTLCHTPARPGCYVKMDTAEATKNVQDTVPDKQDSAGSGEAYQPSEIENVVFDVLNKANADAGTVSTVLGFLNKAKEDKATIQASRAKSESQVQKDRNAVNQVMAQIIDSKAAAEGKERDPLTLQNVETMMSGGDISGDFVGTVKASLLHLTAQRPNEHKESHVIATAVQDYLAQQQRRYAGNGAARKMARTRTGVVRASAAQLPPSVKLTGVGDSLAKSGIDPRVAALFNS